MNRPLDLTLFSPEGGVASGSFSDLAGRSRRLSQSTADHAAMVSRVIEGLGGSEAARRRLGSHYASLTSLNHESDSLLFFSGLTHLAQTLSREQRIPEALFLYSAIQESAPENLQAVRDAARRETNALTGVGAMSPRVEVLTRSFAQQATDPAMLISMGGAQVVFGATRLALLSRLTASPTAGAFTRGFGARALASVGAFAVEGPAFVGIHHGVNGALGRAPAGDSNLFHELAGTYLTLGGLKLAAWAGTGAFNRVHRINPLTGQATRLTGLSRVSQALIPQTSTLAGIYAGHELEMIAGLRPRTDGATTFIDSLATLAQFAVAGRLMNGAFGPEFARFNREIHLRTNLASQAHLSASSFGTSRVQEILAQVFPRGRDRAVLATPEGLTLPAEGSRLPNQMLMAGNGESGNGGERGNGRTPSIPPSGNGNGSLPPPPNGADSNPPPAGGGSRNWGRAAGRLAINTIPPVLKALGRFDWNRFHDPNEALRALHTSTLPTPPESIEMGIRLSLGHNSREQLDSIARRARRDLGFFHTHDLSRARDAYVAVERARQEVQRGERERLAPIFPIYRNLVEGVRTRSQEIERSLENYESKAREIFGEQADMTLADAMVEAHWARQIRVGEEFRKNLTEDELRRLGYEPVTAENASDKFDFFVPGAIEILLDRNPILGGATEAAELRAAAGRQYYEALPRQLEARELVEQVRVLEIEKNELSEDSPERNANRIAAIDTEIKGLGVRIKGLEREALGAARPLKNALTRFLADPERARAWTLETALHSTVRAALHENSGGLLDAVLARISKPETMPEAEWQALESRINRYRQAVVELGEQRDRKGFRSVADIFARAVRGRDYRDLWRAMGEVERAATDIFLHHENALIPPAIDYLSARVGELSEARRNEMIGLRQGIRADFREMGRWGADRLKEMTPHVLERYRYRDSEYKELRAGGMRAGLTLLDEIMEKVQDRLAPDRNQDAPPPEWVQLRARIEGEIEKYLQAVDEGREGRLNPRDYNRRVEEPVKLLMKRAFPYVERQAREAGLDMGRLPRIVPLFENYTLPFDLVPERGFFERWGRVARYGAPAVKRMVQLFSAERNNYPFQEYTRRFLDYGRVVGDSAGRQTFYLPGSFPRLHRYFRATRSDAHWTHLDFIGLSANSVHADRGTAADASDSPDIVAKFDLAVPVIDQVFPLLVNSISNDRSGVRSAEIRASQIQSFGFPQGRRLRRMDPLNYDAITMAVGTARSPLVGEVHEPVNESWLPIGRVWHVNGGVRLLTAKDSGVSLGTDLGAIRNYPNQRGPFMLDTNPSNYTHLFLPASAFPEPAAGAAKNTRLQLERMLWELQGMQPELNPPAPQTYELYRNFANPAVPEVERQVAQLFSGIEELYPSVEGVRRLWEDAEFLREVVASEAETEGRTTPQARQDLETTERALRVQAARNVPLNSALRHEVLRRLSDLDQRLARDISERLGIPEGSSLSFTELKARLRAAVLGRWVHSEAQIEAEETVTLRRYQRILRSRIRLMEGIEEKIGNGEPLGRIERRLLEKMAGTISQTHSSLGEDPIIGRIETYLAQRGSGTGHPHGPAITNGLIDLMRETRNAEIPERRAALGLLQKRLNQSRRAFSHFRLGMELTPAERVLLEDLEGSFTRTAGEGPRDALVEALRRETPPSPAEMRQLLAEEEIREYTRWLIQKLPGSGTGSVDAVEESTRDLSRVRFNADGEVISGPNERLTTYPYLFGFMGVAAALGVAGGLDLLTFNRFKLYNATAHRVAQAVYSVVRWRPVVTPDGIRALERGRIESRRQGRPLTLNANHTSWADIGAMTTIFPEGRFVYKYSLLLIPGLNMALVGGRHVGITRPSSKDPARRQRETERADRQLAASVPRMKRYGISVETFIPGTRSATGSVGKPKAGGAAIANKTNAITLVNSLFGMDQLVPKNNTEAFVNGVGTHRRAYMDFRYLDPQELNLPANDRARITGLTRATQEQIIEMFLQQVAHLRSQAEAGDSIAEGQLTQFLRRISPGMDLVRAGRNREAREWADRMKTDADFLKTFTEWWDAQISSWHPRRLR